MLVVSLIITTDQVKIIIYYWAIQVKNKQFVKINNFSIFWKIIITLKNENIITFKPIVGIP